MSKNKKSRWERAAGRRSAGTQRFLRPALMPLPWLLKKYHKTRREKNKPLSEISAHPILVELGVFRGQNSEEILYRICSD